MIDHVNSSATFSSWRDTTNEIIDAVNVIPTTIAENALTLSSPDQIVTQTPTFEGGLNTNLIGTGGDPLVINGELSVNSGLLTLADVTYEFSTDEPGLGTTLLVNTKSGTGEPNMIAFESLEDTAAAITAEALLSLGAGVFTATAVPVGIIHPAIPNLSDPPARWLPMNSTSADLIYDSNPQLSKYAILRVIYSSRGAFLAAADGDDTKLIKAEEDPVSVFSVSHGGGLSFEKSEDGALISSSTFSIDTAKISLNLNSSQLEINANNQLGVKDSGLSNATLASATTSADANAIPIRLASGHLTVPGDPTQDTHAASKRYVDSAVDYVGNISSADIVSFPSTGATYSTHSIGAAIYQTVSDDVIVYGEADRVGHHNRFGDAQTTENAIGHNINRRTDEGVKKVYADARAVYIQYNDDSVWAYGDNTTGRAGIQDLQKPFTEGEPAFDNEEISFVAVNHDYASANVFAVSSDRSALWVAGDNTHGQLGIGNTATGHSGGIKAPSTPLFGGNLIQDVKLVGGWNRTSGAPRTTSYVLTDSGQVYAAGHGREGQCGQGNNTAFNNEFAEMKYEDVVDYDEDSDGVFLVEGSAVKGISAYGAQGRTGIFTITEAGNVYGCGFNGFGIFGRNNKTNATRLAPVWVANSYNPAKEADQIYTDVGQTAHIITKDKELWSAGDNRFGQCGIDSNAHDILTWSHVGGNLGTCEKLWVATGRIREQNSGGRWGTSRGARFAIFKKEGVDALYAWGNNESGQLGLGYRSLAVISPQRVYLPRSVDLNLISDIAGTFAGSGDASKYRRSVATTILVKRSATDNRCDVYHAGGTPFNHNAVGTLTEIQRFTRQTRLV